MLINKCVVFYDYTAHFDCGKGFGIGDTVKWLVFESNVPDLPCICVDEDDHRNYFCEDDEPDAIYQEVPVTLGRLDYCYEYYDSKDDDLLALEGKLEKIELLYVKYRRSKDNPLFLISVDSKLIEFKDSSTFEKRVDGMLMSGYVITVSDYTVKPAEKFEKRKNGGYM